jgi:ABC-type amino acid transport system permease subunit
VKDAAVLGAIIVAFLLVNAWILKLHVVNVLVAGWKKEFRSTPGALSVGFACVLLLLGVSMVKEPELARIFCVLKGVQFDWQPTVEQRFGPWVLVGLAIAFFFMNIMALGLFEAGKGQRGR